MERSTLHEYSSNMSIKAVDCHKENSVVLFYQPHYALDTLYSEAHKIHVHV